MTFSTVLLDPPWPERGGGRCKRGADRHYPVITTQSEMLSTIVRAEPWRPACDSHMYMWATDNYLEWALWLIPALGFKRHRTLPWIKSRMGLGQYFRGCHELFLFATRGRGKNACNPGTFRTDALMRQLEMFEGRRLRHSEKPESSYRLIEARSKGPYLEMFARKRRPGWEAWGDGLPEVNVE